MASPVASLKQPLLPRHNKDDVKDTPKALETAIAFAVFIAVRSFHPIIIDISKTDGKLPYGKATPCVVNSAVDIAIGTAATVFDGAPRPPWPNATFNPAKPHETLEPLINDFFKEVSWNRSKGANTDRVKNASEAVLGQTVRIKNLEKKAELNGRCGVCIGFEKDQDRYVIRLITGGVESDVALRDQNFSILKPKLCKSMVKVHGLQSKPELNGRYGFVDEFLRENERYRVFLPAGGLGRAQFRRQKRSD
eukprot:g22317.t1